jgi:hypothetical protein
VAMDLRLCCVLWTCLDGHQCIACP